QVRRDCEVTGIEPDPDGVTVRMLDSGTEVHVRAGYVVGCDGAHSTVRQQLGVDFPGDEIPEAYMLADVEVDWDLPTGYAVRCTRRGAEREEILMCVPLPGAHRYRMSMLAAQDLLDHPSNQEPGGGPRQAPQLRHIQDVVDRLSPQPAWVHSMRWSSVFRMSHRLAQRYSVGRVFLAGDAAHVHPPTGAQGMNTGLQDAYNLGWKLAMVLSGDAAPSLLDSYHVERHPVGEEVVGRTTRASRTAAGAGDDRGALAVLREAQLLVAYPDSPLNAPDTTSEHLAEGPPPGNRAPDAGGLRQDCLAGSLRWHEMLRHPLHTLLLWAAGPAAVSEAEALARRVADLAPGLVRAYIAVPGATPHVNASGHVLADGGGALGAAYGFAPAVSQVQGYLIRPDGYVGYRSSHPAADELVQHLRTAYGSPTRHAAMAQTS
ncbi:MAG: FAD-dependent monooxygenase, partial [Microlunatus sp.]|nr:FAD-dependent monooxygenase [Microlunatus sp.]